MKVDWVILANAAEVRDGMVNVISGGWNVAARPSYPSMFFGAIAARLLFEPAEARTPHTLRVSVLDSQGQVLAQVPLEVPPPPQPPPDPTPVGFEMPLTIASNLTGVTIPAPGVYYVSLAVDGLEQRKIPMVFVVAPSGPAPPGVQQPRSEGSPG
jgi:hypothetical protein